MDASVADVFIPERNVAEKSRGWSKDKLHFRRDANESTGTE